MVKAILFDFFGTIAVYGDMKEADEKSYKIMYDYVSSKDNSVAYDWFVNVWNENFNTPITLDEKTEDTIFLTKISKVFKAFNIAISSSEIAQIGQSCVNTWQSHISFPEDMHLTFRFLKSKYKLALVSNFDHPVHLRKLLVEKSLLNYFDSVVISGEIGINKPDSKIFETALKELNVLSSEAIFIGDNMIDDISGAQCVGCKIILMDAQNLFKDFKGNKIAQISDLLSYNFCK
jgi:putative hydrolase of the HAD superfamily